MSVWDMLVCFLLSAVVGTGVGGGGLFLVYLTGPLGFGQLPAQALHLFYFLSAAAPSVLTKLRVLPWRTAGLCIAGGLPGVYLGSLVRDLLPEGSLQKGFGILLILSGAAVFFVREKTQKKPRDP